MIGWYVHHQGRGHLTRACAIARWMGMPVTGLSSLPRPSAWPGPWVQLSRDDDLVEEGTPRDVEAGGVLHWAPVGHVGLASRAADITGWVAREQPQLVVVDVSVEVTLLARLAGAPVAVVALPGERLDRAHGTAYDLAEALLAPWPAGTHECGWKQEWVAKAHAVGGISQFDGVPHPRVPRRPGRVLLLWGGGGTDVSSAEVRAARRATPDWTWVERSPSQPSPDLWRELHECDVVVTHAGQNAVADVAAARAPAVLVAQTRPFGEQVATAHAVHGLGSATGLEAWPAAGAWPDLLASARDRGGAGWDRWTTGRGAEEAARALRAVCTSPAQAPVRT